MQACEGTWDFSFLVAPIAYLPLCYAACQRTLSTCLHSLAFAANRLCTYNFLATAITMRVRQRRVQPAAPYIDTIIPVFTLLTIIYQLICLLVPAAYINILVFACSQIVDYNFLASLIAAIGRYMPDFKRASADAVAGSAGAGAKKTH